MESIGEHKPQRCPMREDQSLIKGCPEAAAGCVNLRKLQLLRLAAPEQPPKERLGCRMLEVKADGTAQK